MKHTIFKYLTIWFLVTQIIPMYSRFVPIHGAIDIAIYVCATIFLFPDLLKTKRVLWLTAYSAIMGLLFISGNRFFEGLGNYIVPTLAMYSGLLLCEYVFKYDSTYSLTKTVFFCATSFCVLMAIISIPQLWIQPNLIRGASIFAAETGTDMQEAFWILNYGTVHGLPFIISPLFFISRKYLSEKNKWYIRIIPFTAFIILLYVIYLSQATTATLVAFLMFAASFFFYSQVINRQTIGRIIIICMFGSLVLNDTILIGMLETAQVTMDSSGSNYKKIDEMKSQIQYGDTDGDLGSRYELYDTSWKLFGENPLFGTSNPANISHHTFLVDRLALLGIVFVIPLILLLITHFKYVFNNLQDGQICYILGFGAFMILIYLKNEFGTGTWFFGFALLPIFCRYMDYVDNK